MSGGVISGNSAQASGVHGLGGGVKVDKGGTFTMNDGEISGNFAKGDGGGIYLEGTFTMKGGAISGNITGPSPEGATGGGVLVASATFIMEGGVISGNTAVDENGGGVGMYNGDSTFIMIGGTIYGSADRLPAGVDASLANNAPSGVALFSRGTARWGTGGTYTKGGVAQAGGSDIGRTNDTLIAIPAR